jgi:hypothetical protein
MSPWSQELVEIRLLRKLSAVRIYSDRLIDGEGGAAIAMSL